MHPASTRSAGTAATALVRAGAPALGTRWAIATREAASGDLRLAACQLLYCNELYSANTATAVGAFGGGGILRRTFGAAAAASSPARAAGTTCAAGSMSTATATAVTAATATSSPPSSLSFSDHRAVFEGQSTWQLLRAYGVLRACGYKPLVSQAESLLAVSRRLVGERATDALVKSTFFAHFCAGEDVSEVQRTVDRLRALEVGAILDYAAEDDVGPTTAAASDRSAAPEVETASTEAASLTGAAKEVPQAGFAEPSPRALGVVGRTYDYESEEQCDRHVEHFLAAIEMAARQPGRPAFAAIKMTALGNPDLLQRASSAISMLHGLFSRFDEDGSGFIDRGEFKRQWRRLVGSGGGGGGLGPADAGAIGATGAPKADGTPGSSSSSTISQAEEDTFQWLDLQGTGKVDYVSWCQRLNLRHMPMLAARIQEGGNGEPGAGSRAVVEACLDGEEVRLMDALLARLQRLVTAALRLDVRLMIDAEHTYFQPAIEHVTLRLMREHNRNGVARVLNTYQAYLIDSRDRLLRDLERSRREGWVLGAKLVRGAYLHLERRRAEQLGLPSPVWPTLELTHANFDRCTADLLEGVRAGRAEVLLGTHNQPSVEAAVARMAALGLPPSSSPGTPGVLFGQLLGMSDHLTLTLGKAGYRAYKYVPYGRVGQVMPYLLRRAAENQDVIEGSKQDLVMLQRELWRRATVALGLGGADGRPVTSTA